MRGRNSFQQKLSGWSEKKDRIIELQTVDGDQFRADAVILATGHSARDIFQLFQEKKEIHAKPFALGVRVEHPQELINSIQYRYLKEEGPRVSGLPPAAYQLVHTQNNRSVFSFACAPVVSSLRHPLMKENWSLTAGHLPNVIIPLPIQASL
jgi:uncharacterized FAD-dependent dehydrogenase